MNDPLDVTATIRLPDKGKATVEFTGGKHGHRRIELTDDERTTIEDVLIGAAARHRQGGRRG